MFSWVVAIQPLPSIVGCPRWSKSLPVGHPGVEAGPRGTAGSGRRWRGRSTKHPSPSRVFVRVATNPSRRSSAGPVRLRRLAERLAAVDHVAVPVLVGEPGLGASLADAGLAVVA